MLGHQFSAPRLEPLAHLGLDFVLQQADGPDAEALGFHPLPLPDEGDFRRPASDIDVNIIPVTVEGCNREVRKDEVRFLPTPDDVDGDPGPLADGLDHLGTIGRLAHRTRGTGPKILHAHRPEQQVEGLDGEGQGLLLGRADSPSLEDVLAKPDGDARVGHLVRTDLTGLLPDGLHHQPDRIGSNVDCPVASAHGFLT